MERGFSMMEMVVYIAIMAVLTTVVFQMISSMISSRTRLQNASDLSSSAVSSLQRMETEIRKAHDVSLKSSSDLVVSKTDEVGAEQSAEFSVSQGRLQVSDTAGGSGPLTIAGVAVTSLNFTLLSASSSRAVAIDLGLNGTIFHLTVALRPI